MIGSSVTRPRIVSPTPLRLSAGATLEALDVIAPALYVEGDDVTLTNVNVCGILVVKASKRFTADNCEIRGNDKGQTLVTILDSDDFTLNECTVRPSTPSVGQDGIKTNSRGRVVDCEVSGTVDGIVLYGGAVEIRGSWVHNLVAYDVDPNQGGKRSHCDAVQIQKGYGHRIIDCTLGGGNNAAVMVTQDVGTVGDLTIESSRLAGGAASVNIKTNKGVAPYGPPMIVRACVFAKGTTTGGLKNGGAIIAGPKFSGLSVVDCLWDDGSPVVADRGSDT